MEKEEWYKKEFEDISKLISKSNSLSLCDFLRIRNFKIRNSSRADEGRIKHITQKALELAEEDKIKEAVEGLCKLDGVRIPIASTILAMKYPDKYAIIDINVIKALDKEKEWSKHYLTDSDIYKEYTLIMRKLAKNKGLINLRELEFELFLREKR